MAATKDVRRLQGKKGQFVGHPHKPAPPKPPADAPPVIPVDAMRATVPIAGFKFGRRKT